MAMSTTQKRSHALRMEILGAGVSRRGDSPKEVRVRPRSLVTNAAAEQSKETHLAGNSCQLNSVDLLVGEDMQSRTLQLTSRDQDLTSITATFVTISQPLYLLLSSR